MSSSHPNNNRPISVRPSDAARASLSIGQQLSDATARIQQSGSITSFFDPRELKRLRQDANAMAAEQAAALVINRTGMARETGLQAIDLARKQQLAEVAHAQTATTAQLQRQAHSAGARAMTRAVEQEQTLQNEIRASRCAPEDKALLAQFVKQLAIESIETIYGEQQTPFGMGAAAVPQYQAQHHHAQQDDDPTVDPDEHDADAVQNDDLMT